MAGCLFIVVKDILYSRTTFGEVAKSVGMLTIINKADVMRSGAFRVAHFSPDVFLLNRSWEMIAVGREREWLCQRALGQILAFADTIDMCAYTDSQGMGWLPMLCDVKAGPISKVWTQYRTPSLDISKSSYLLMCHRLLRTAPTLPSPSKAHQCLVTQWLGGRGWGPSHIFWYKLGQGKLIQKEKKMGPRLVSDSQTCQMQL